MEVVRVEDHAIPFPRDGHYAANYVDHVRTDVKPLDIAA